MAKTVADDICVANQSEANAPAFCVSWAEDALQTLKKGWPVFVTALGFAKDVASDTPITIMGIAEEDAHNLTVAGVANTSGGPNTLLVALANGTTIFSANVKSTSLADRVLLQSDIGSLMGIQRDTTNNRLFLNASVKGGASARVYTLAVTDGTEVGDTNGRVQFVFLPNFSQTMGTS